MGDPQEEDKVLFDEQDEAFYLDVKVSIDKVKELKNY
jgi:hypothetical protein